LVVVVVIQRQASAAVALDDALAIDLVIAFVGHLRGLLPGVGPGSAPPPHRWFGGALVRRAAEFAGLRFGTHRILLLRVGVHRNDNRCSAVDIGHKNVACPPGRNAARRASSPRWQAALGTSKPAYRFFSSVMPTSSSTAPAITSTMPLARS